MKKSVSVSLSKETPSKATSSHVSENHSQSKKKCFQPIEFDKEGNAVQANSNRMSIGWDVQDFYQLRDECVKNKTHFEDPMFPADDSSLYGPEGPTKDGQLEGPIVWKRPIELCPDRSCFATDGISRFDIQLGRLKNSWLITALVSLTAHPTLFHRVVPRDNYETSGQVCAGIYHFRFWRFGQWYDVVIDDRLPTINNELVYMHSTDTCEFWSALLEKAYAKLLGSYEALQRGFASEAMVDLTGGISESYGTKCDPKSLFAIMECAGRSALVGCCINGSAVGTVTSQGLVEGYSYAITKAVTVQLEDSSQSISLVRLRSPIADGKEWNGDWSDKCGKWRKVSKETISSLGVVDQVDGEFWMCFDDFLKYFDRVDVCNLTVTQHSSDAIQATDTQAGWLETCYRGHWVKNVSAGGSQDWPDSHWSNPQYVIELKSSGGCGDGGHSYKLIVSLMQRQRHIKPAADTSEWLPIGFALYNVTSTAVLQKPLPQEWFEYQRSVGCCAHKCRREATERFELEAGTYVLVPSTKQPNQVGDFMLRVFCRAAIDMKENDCVQLECVPRSSRHQLCKEVKQKLEKIFDSCANDQRELDWMRLKMVLDKQYAREIRKVSDGLKKTYSPQSLLKAKFSATTTDSGFTTSLQFESVFSFLQCCFPSASNGELEPDHADLDTTADSTVHGFSKDACRMMITMLDEDDSGALGWQEFLKLITMIEQLKKDFNRFDTDDSGSLDSTELQEALKQSSPIKLHREMLAILMRRYSTTGDKIWFDDYIALVFKMHTIVGQFIRTGWKPNGELSHEMQQFLLNMVKL